MRDDERRGGSVSEKDDYILSKDSSKGELLCNNLFFWQELHYLLPIKSDIPFSSGHYFYVDMSEFQIMLINNYTIGKIFIWIKFNFIILRRLKKCYHQYIKHFSTVIQVIIQSLSSIFYVDIKYGTRRGNRYTDKNGKNMRTTEWTAIS